MTSNEFPLTDIQLAYLVGRSSELFLGGNSVHMYMEFEGNALPDKTEYAFNKLISRHEALRLTVNSIGTQTVAVNVPFYKIECDDLSNLNSDEAESRIRLYRDQNAQKIYPVDVWPMFKLHCFRMSDKVYRYAFDADLMIMDRSSIEIMFRELSEIYSGGEDRLSESGKKFTDYVMDRRSDREKRSEDDGKFWKDLIDREEIRMSENIPSVDDVNCSGHKFVSEERLIPAEKWNRICEELMDRRIVSSVYIMTAYAKTLSVWQNTSAPTVNMTTSVRTVGGKSYGGVMGDFTDIVIVPYSFEPESNLFSVSRSVQKKLTQYTAHDGFGGIKVMNELAERNNADKSGIYPYAFTCSIEGQTSFMRENVLGRNVYQISQTPQLRIDCQVYEDNEGILIRFDYPEGIACGNTVGEMLDYMTNLILGEDVSFVTERQKEYNITDGNLPEETVQEMFKKSAARFPARTAVGCGEKKLSYSEFDRLSDGYARAVSARGMESKRVAVKAVRSAETVALFMGILKTGGSYIPVDPKWPDERVDFIMKQSDCGLYVSAESLEPLYDDEPYAVKGSKNDEAYIIFTSGSTGRPKGVMITQQAVCNTLSDINERMEVTEEDVVAGVSSFCFDLSVYDIFGALISGAELALSESVSEAVDTAVNSGATIWNTVPAIMELFVNSIGSRKCSLRKILLSGDWIPLKLKSEISNKIPGADVYSLGGATEASVWSIIYPIDDVRPEWKSIPYGYPLKNQSIWILGENDNICPVNVIGEICIGGVGTAAGYVGDKEKTDAQFFVHPELGRLYRTGDYGVFRSEGYVEFIGRRDFQVKLHGYRIELGEIENALNETESIETALAEVIESDNGSQHLFAYAVPAKGGVNKGDAELEMAVAESGAYASSVPSEGMTPEEYKLFSDTLDDAGLFVMRNTFAEWGLLCKKDEPVSADIIVNRGLAEEKYRKLMDQWITVLCSKGDLYADDCGTVRCRKTYEPNDISLVEKSLYKIPQHELVNGFRDFMILGARGMKPILCGEESPLQILFPEGSWDRAENIYRYNPYAVYLNRISSEIIFSYAEKLLKKKRKIRILEVGAGVGGTTHAIVEKLAALEAADIEYHYTDLSEFFTARAKEELSEYDFIRYGKYNMDIHPQIQGYEPDSFDIIFGANCVHDAVKLKKSLSYMRLMLKRNGMLLLLEISGNLIHHKTTIGLIDGFSGYDDERLKQNEPLLTAEQWKEYLKACEYGSVMSFPPKGSEYELFNQHIIAAFSKNSSAVIDENNVKEKIGRRLTEYMIPEKIFTIPSLPLTANGKVDRKALPVPDLSAEGEGNSERAPVTELQKKIISVFENVLKISGLSIDMNIFKTGADSLRAIMMISELEKAGVVISLSELYKYPSAVQLEAFVTAENRLKEYKGFKLREKTENELYAPFRLTDQQQSYAFGRVPRAEEIDALPTGGYLEFTVTDLDKDKLERALNKIIEENDIFRCRYNDDGTAQILKSVPYRKIPCHDVRGLNENELSEYLVRTRKRITSEGPDLKAPPVMITEISRLDEHTYYLHIYIDGLMLDGWSFELFIAELGNIYLTGSSMYEKPASVRFTDYIDYINEFKESDKYKADKNYWLERIDNLPSTAELPQLRNIKELGRADGVQNECGISEDCWNKLAVYAAEYGVSMFSVLLTSFQYVIGKWNNKRRFLLNIPEFNRPDLSSDVDRVMGVFSSFLYFDSDIDTSVSFAENVKKTQQQIIELKEHNSFTGMEITREINRRSEEHTTDVLAPICFGMMPDAANHNETYMRIERDLFRLHYQENHTALVWIDINVVKRSGRVDFNWCSVEGLFDDGLMREMTSAQERILIEASESRDFWEKSLRLPLPEEDRRIIDAANDTYMPLEYKSFPEILRENFGRYSDRECICDIEHSYTYAETEQLVKNAAAQLASSGVSQGDKVAIYTEKSVSQIIYIIAMAYMGAVFVPIEYSLPTETVIKCMEQTDCKCIIASAERQSKFEGMAFGVIEDDVFSVPNFDGDISFEVPDADSLIYIMHTSGSTGIPKAVAIHQQGLQNCVEYTMRHCRLNETDRSIALTNAAHDLLVYDIFGLLYVGGSVAVPNESDFRDPQKWIELIDKRKVTLWNTVPAMQEMLMEYIPSEQEKRISSLKTVILGGDYVKASLADKIFRTIPDVHLLSIGGATETTIWDIMHSVTKDDAASGVVPYGKPIGNTRYHILNENLDELPAGVTGMMYCEGVQVAKGYYGNAEETDKKFIVHPVTGRLLYKTGDMGMYKSNGDIIFMGRRDNQVKIRGNRIELDGINRIIGETENVVRSVVIVEKQHIVAFYSSDSGDLNGKITAALEAELPDYMIPDSIIRVDSIPLRPNGKTDTKALVGLYESICEAETVSDSADSGETNDLTDRILNMFTEILGIDIKPHDDFFEFGGDSISAIRTMNMIRELCPDYSLKDFYRSHCAADIAADIMKRQGDDNIV